MRRESNKRKPGVNNSLSHSTLASVFTQEQIQAEMRAPKPGKALSTPDAAPPKAGGPPGPPGGNDSKRLIDRKDAIQIALKEYDGLRKEIDARTDGTKTYAWPVILLVGGTVASWKLNISLDVVLFILPTVVMTILALAANAAHDMDKARKALARVENRVFLLSGETLLTHESCRVIEWQRNSGKHLAALLLVPLCYWISEVSLYILLDIASTLQSGKPPLEGNNIFINPNSSYEARRAVLMAAGVIPTFIYCKNVWGWYQLHNRGFKPSLPLMNHIESNHELIEQPAKPAKPVIA